MIEVTCSAADLLPIDAIEEFQGNLKTRTKADIEQIITSITKYGFSFPFFVWNGTGHNYCLDGHGRIQALAEMRRRGEDIPLLPVAYIEAADEAEAKQKLLRMNSQFGKMTQESILEFMDGLEIAWDELSLPAVKIDALSGTPEAEARRELATDFIVPPFSILDTRTARWMDRKKAWKTLIQDRGESRETVLFTSSVLRDLDFYRKKTEAEERLGKKLSYSEFEANYYTAPNNLATMNGSSILDPVLAEIMIQWFCPETGCTFDPFAGDSVFGYVSSALGHPFTGIELREEQTALNAERIAEYPESRYICDDGQNVGNHLPPESQDFLFSCPPYFDLEIYSDDPRDASNQGSYEDFLIILGNAYKAAAKCLKPNRFAVIVIGDIRDKAGYYRRLPDDIKTIFASAGMKLLNELILIDPIGTARLRAGGYMEHRKVAKTHQNVLVFYNSTVEDIREIYADFTEKKLRKYHDQVLVFYNGDPKTIKDIYPPVETDESEDLQL